jgi:hypothetical protein
MSSLHWVKIVSKTSSEGSISMEIIVEDGMDSDIRTFMPQSLSSLFSYLPSKAISSELDERLELSVLSSFRNIGFSVTSSSFHFLAQTETAVQTWWLEIDTSKRALPENTVRTGGRVVSMRTKAIRLGDSAPKRQEVSPKKDKPVPVYLGEDSSDEEGGGGDSQGGLAEEDDEIEFYQPVFASKKEEKEEKEEEEKKEKRRSVAIATGSGVERTGSGEAPRRPSVARGRSVSSLLSRLGKKKEEEKKEEEKKEPEEEE